MPTGPSWAPTCSAKRCPCSALRPRWWGRAWSTRWPMIVAMWQNVLCAFMSWEGYNFEDAVVVSESLGQEDKFSSIHMEKHEAEARDTKLGPEEITRDIPNVGEESLRDLDEE